MACNCKCCCGCCCDGEEGTKTKPSDCAAPLDFKGVGTICDVCCVDGEVSAEIDTEAACDAAGGAWVVNGKCQEAPCGGPGACCDPVFGCFIGTAEDCSVIPGATFMGPETACYPDPCECNSPCNWIEEVVYYAYQTGQLLVHDGDSYPNCLSGYDLPEVISGTFSLPDCLPYNSCGCQLSFRFWRNLYSPCLGSNGLSGSDSDITTQTVVVECTVGTVTVHTTGGDITLTPGQTHTFNTIQRDPSGGNVSSSTYGECFSVETKTPFATFKVTATLNWSNETDHDLYGHVNCGACP